MPSAPTRLHLRNDLVEISRLTEELEAFCARHQVPNDALLALNLALEEIVTNVICHALVEGEHTIDVELLFDDGTVEARVEDTGPHFDPLQQEDPDVEAPLEERRIGGLGVVLVKRLMDDVAYTRRDGRNVLTIRKRAAAPGHETPEH